MAVAELLERGGRAAFHGRPPDGVEPLQIARRDGRDDETAAAVAGLEPALVAAARGVLYAGTLGS